MKRKTLFWLVLAGMASAAVMTQAQPGDSPRSGPSQREGDEGPRYPRPPKPPIETALDTDGDGEISAREIKGASAALLKLDKNGDGKLTPEEYRPRRPRCGMGPADGDYGRPPRQRDGNQSPGKQAD